MGKLDGRTDLIEMVEERGMAGKRYPSIDVPSQREGQRGRCRGVYVRTYSRYAGGAISGGLSALIFDSSPSRLSHHSGVQCRIEVPALLLTRDHTYVAVPTSAIETLYPYGVATSTNSLAAWPACPPARLPARLPGWLPTTNLDRRHSLTIDP